MKKTRTKKKKLSPKIKSPLSRNYLAMKKQTIFSFFLLSLSLIFIIACGEKSETQQAYKKTSTGPLNQVSVFSTEDVYKSIEPALEDTLIFGKVFPGLYYPPEIMFATRFFDSKNFNRFKYTRLVLNIKSGEPHLLIEKDKYARPQAYVEVQGKNNAEIIQLLQKNQDSILNTYRWADRAFLLDGYADKTKSSTAELDSLGVSMLIPNDFKMVEANTHFVWYRKDKVNTITNRNANNDLVNKSSSDILNIMLFKVPYKKPSIDIKEAIKISDSIMGIYTEGGKEPQVEYIGKDSLKVFVKDHVQVEKNPMLRDFYDFKQIKPNPSDGVEEYETQGYWSMTLTQMGGPYTMKLLLDKKNKTLYAAQAILFAPLNQGKSKKRDYLTSMEGLFTTFKIKP